MKTYWKMPAGLKEKFDYEIHLSKSFFIQNDLVSSWERLERAHIIGQPWAVEHTISHWKMLLFAYKIKKINEIFGQLPRLFVGGLKSFIGEIPSGNTGGSNIHPLKKLPIPDDILKIMNPYYQFK